MKIIAYDPPSYLIDVGNKQGRIYNAVEKKLYPPQNITSIIMKGEWMPYTGPQDFKKLGVK